MKKSTQRPTTVSKSWSRDTEATSPTVKVTFFRPTPSARGRQKLRIGVNANDCAVPSYNVGDDERDVARAAPHIENLHSKGDTCILEKSLRVRPKHLRLPQQAVGLSL